MAQFWSRKDKRTGGLPPSLASQAVDFGTLIQNGPKPWVEGAVPQQPAMRHPEEEFRRPAKGLRRALRLLWDVARLKGWKKRRRASREAKESQRTARLQALVDQRIAELERLPEEPRTCQKATRGWEAQQEKQVAVVTAINVCSTAPHLEEDDGDEAIVRCKAWDGDVPRGGGGRGDEMDQTQPLVQADTSGDKERTTGFEAKDAATIPGGDRDGQDFKPLSAERRSEEEECRRKMWEKLRRLGEDMAGWEERSTRDLAVRLTEVVLQTRTEMYPTETGDESDQLEQEQGTSGARVGSSEEMHALVDTHADVTSVQLCRQLQDLAVYHHVPVSISETVYGDEQHLPAMLEPLGSEQIWEDSDDDLLEQGEPPAAPVPLILMLCSVTAGEVMNEEQWRKEFWDVWAQHEMDCGLVSEEVKVSGTWAPFRRQRPLSPEMEGEVVHILRALLAEGVVVKGKSSFNSPIKLVQKHQTWRLVLDCTELNWFTDRVVAPVSLDVNKLFTTLSPNSRYFSVVDLSNASFAIPLAEGSRARFAFTFRGEQYLFTRLPQGFRCTNSIVHLRVEEMLSQLTPTDKACIVHYEDDILITGRTQSKTEARTKRVLELMKKMGFKAKFEKAQLVQSEVDYLGLTIGAKGRKIQARKLEDIVEAPSPSNIRGLRSVLGKFSSMKNYIPGYWELAHPLQRLAQQQVRWKWGPEEEQALNRLKDAALTAPPLRFPRKSHPFLIRLVIGREVVSASLLQEDRQGQLGPVEHSSRVLKRHQVSYLPQEKGCLAAVWAMQAFRALLGSAPILLQIPHSPWQYLRWGEALGSSGSHPCPAQWTLLLVNKGTVAQGSHPEHGDPAGTLVCTAPPLQQLPPSVPKANVWFMASQEVSSVGFAAASLEERWLLGVTEGSSVLEAELVALRQLLLHHRCPSPLYVYTGCSSLVQRLQSQSSEWEEWWASSEEDLWPSILEWICANPGVLHIRCVGGYRSQDLEEREWNQKVRERARAMSGRATGRLEIWEPSKYEKQEIIAKCHSYLHEGVAGTLARVREVVPWEGDSQQVTRWVQSCLRCSEGRRGAGLLPPQRTEGPWSQLWVDHITKEGQDILVVGDEFSGWVEAFPGWDVIPEVMELFARYGTPRTIRLSHLPYFHQLATRLMGATSTELLWDVPRARPVGSVMGALERVVQGAGKEWREMLPLIVAGIRSIAVKKAALNPYTVLCGFPLEVRWGCEGDACPPDNVLPWLRGMQEDGAWCKRRMEAALGDCLEGAAAWP